MQSPARRVRPPALSLRRDCDLELPAVNPSTGRAVPVHRRRMPELQRFAAETDILIALADKAVGMRKILQAVHSPRAPAVPASSSSSTHPKSGESDPSRRGAGKKQSAADPTADSDPHEPHPSSTDDSSWLPHPLTPPQRIPREPNAHHNAHDGGGDGRGDEDDDDDIIPSNHPGTRGGGGGGGGGAAMSCVHLLRNPPLWVIATSSAPGATVHHDAFCQLVRRYQQTEQALRDAVYLCTSGTGGGGVEETLRRMPPVDALGAGYISSSGADGSTASLAASVSWELTLDLHGGIAPDDMADIWRAAGGVALTAGDVVPADAAPAGMTAVIQGAAAPYHCHHEDDDAATEAVPQAAEADDGGRGRGEGAAHTTAAGEKHSTGEAAPSSSSRNLIVANWPRQGTHGQSVTPVMPPPPTWMRLSAPPAVTSKVALLRWVQRAVIVPLRGQRDRQLEDIREEAFIAGSS